MVADELFTSLMKNMTNLRGLEAKYSTNFCSELSVNGVPVRIDGAVAQAQTFGNLLRRYVLDHEFEYFAFSLSEEVKCFFKIPAGKFAAAFGETFSAQFGDRFIRRSSSTGFSKNSAAPAFSVVTARSTLACPVRMMMAASTGGGAFPSAALCRSCPAC